MVRASSQYTKVAGSIPSQGTYKNQLMNKWNNRSQIDVSLSPSLPLFLSPSPLSNQFKKILKVPSLHTTRDQSPPSFFPAHARGLQPHTFSRAFFSLLLPEIKGQLLSCPRLEFSFALCHMISPTPVLLMYCLQLKYNSLPKRNSGASF